MKGNNQFLKHSTVKFLLINLVILVNVCKAMAFPPEDKRPNIVIIISDDQGWGDFGFAGNKILKTPNLDKLYNESVCFTNYHVSSVCAPSRASLMTGRYHYRTGLWDTWKGRANMRSEEVTIAEVLTKAGYATGMFGKWHLGTDRPLLPSDQGFQTTCETDNSRTRFDPPVTINGKVEKRKGFLDDINTDEAIRFMEQNTREGKPFFAYVASQLPHDVNGKAIPDNYMELYKNEQGLTEGDKQVYGMITKFDENVGRILQNIKRLGIEENTIIMFMPDNGMLTNSPDLHSQPEQLACKTHNIGQRFNAGLRGGKATVYEGGINVPLLVKWEKQFTPQKNMDALTAHIDLFPTILELCGAPQPNDVQIDGRSVVPLLKGNTTGWEQRLLTIQCHRAEIPLKNHEAATYFGHYKLIDGKQLYDLKIDREEKNNLINKLPDIVAKMTDFYNQWFSSVTEKGFVMSPVWLGKENQPELKLTYTQKFSTGWNVTVQNAGKYRFKIINIRPEIFGTKGAYTLTINSTKHTHKINTATSELDFGYIQLKAGENRFNVVPKGIVKKQKLYYGDPDEGYQYLLVKSE
jgi:arylsulfatase A-like enzyme